ncbi:hypothetical protein [Aestuariibius sp. HNIBRBA575]|uniref:hypothetical protein n=1 Tax=Aestuariibius sp. HNIBRBA575 TaxID=3233343 RepID=UPI0034A11FFE
MNNFLNIYSFKVLAASALFTSGCVPEAAIQRDPTQNSPQIGQGQTQQDVTENSDLLVSQFAGDYGPTICTKSYFQERMCDRPALIIREGGSFFQILAQNNEWFRWPVTLISRQGDRFLFTYIDDQNGGDNQTKQGYFEFSTISGVPAAKFVLDELGDLGESYVDMAQIRNRTNLPLATFGWEISPDLDAASQHPELQTNPIPSRTVQNSASSTTLSCIQTQQIDQDPTSLASDSERTEYFNMCGRPISCQRLDNNQPETIGHSIQISTWIVALESCH